jgi:hypothetical protein
MAKKPDDDLIRSDSPEIRYSAADVRRMRAELRRTAGQCIGGRAARW